MKPANRNIGEALVDSASIRFGLPNLKSEPSTVYATRCRDCRDCDISAGDNGRTCPVCGTDVSSLTIGMRSRDPIMCPECKSVLFICARTSIPTGVITAYMHIHRELHIDEGDII